MSTSKHRSKKHTEKIKRPVIISSLLLCLALTSVLFAKWRPSANVTPVRHAPAAAPLAPPPVPTPALAKEYIYAGDRLLATEEPANAAPAVSITSPGNNFVLLAGSNLPITVNATDSDGTINQVQIFQGAILLGQATAAGGGVYNFTWTNVVVGSYSLTAKAFDNLNTSTTSAPISVISNAPPSVSITAPANNAVFTAPANITITANASDTDGTITQVEFYRGTTLIGSDNTSPYSVAWNSVAAGSYSLTAKATDNRGAITTSSAITVISNAPPSVSITAPANNAVFTAPANITITANASDTDGTITQVEFYRGTTLIGSDNTSPYSVAWNSVAAGSYSLTAKATDNRGAITTSSAITVISNAPPSVSITAPTNNAVFTAPANITITANASDTDGTITQVEFYRDTTLIGSDNTSPYSVAWNSVAAGSYSLTAKATDNRGAITTSSAITVISNAPPSVSITAPANNAVFTAPANITITANASDTDGTITQVEFYRGTTLIGSDNTSPYSVAWNSVAAGSYSLTAKATDNRGAITTSSAITVISNAPPSVSITAPTNNAVFTAPANITITANASDTDGTITQVEFYRDTTLIGSDNTSPYSVAWNSVAAGSYSLTARATDNRGVITTSNAITVISNVLPTVSITAPANNAVFTAPANITITANAGDTDGTITQVEFFQGTTLIGSDNTSPYSFAWNNVPAANYSLTAKATDNRSAVTTSTAINIVVNPGCVPPNGLIISEFRLRGPNGSNDEYVELYNNSDSSITVCTADGSSGWALVSSEGITRFVINSGTVIAPRVHYLAVTGGYSLTGYGGSTPGDISYVSDIADNSGIALFKTSNAANFTVANQLDAVGFTTSGTLYREGGGLSPLGASGGEFAFFRKLNSGTSQDTGDNVADFNFVATNAGVYGSIVAILGGPGPQNRFSPIQRNATLPLVLLDPAVSGSVAPNRVRDTTAIGPNAAVGTLSIRRTVVNNTGMNVTSLRFRIIDITTLNTPGYAPGGSQSDMRVLSCTDFTATLSNGQPALVRGTTLQTPPTQALAGGLNSSVTTGVISLSQPLAPGQTINVQFLLGVQQSGTFRFFVNVEGLVQ